MITFMNKSNDTYTNLKKRKKGKKATQNVIHKKIKRKSDFRLTKNSAKSLEMMFDGYTVFRHISLTHL